MEGKIVLAFGTRPEAIKMSPLFHALKKEGLDPVVLCTGQHREQLLQALDFFKVPFGVNLDVMTECQTLPELAGKMIPSSARALRDLDAAYVLVHGDTLTTFAVAWAAFLERIPLGHVEAGLRSHSMAEPFPEEANRVLTDAISDLYFAPTERAKSNLLFEGKDESRIFVTGQTGVDGVIYASKIGEIPEVLKDKLRDRAKVVTVTLHRRENWPKLPEFGEALKSLAQSLKDYFFVCPLHLNPLVRKGLRPPLEGLGNVVLTEPLEYGAMAALIKRSRLIITDSGGLQEEGAALGIPVAVARDVTERPEGLEAGGLVLVGRDPGDFKDRLLSLMRDQEKLDSMAKAKNPFGDGRASGRIAEILKRRLNL